MFKGPGHKLSPQQPDGSNFILLPFKLHGDSERREHMLQINQGEIVHYITVQQQRHSQFFNRAKNEETLQGKQIENE